MQKAIMYKAKKGNNGCFIYYYNGVEEKRTLWIRQHADEWLAKIKSDIQVVKTVLCSDKKFGDCIWRWYSKYGSVAIGDSKDAAQYFMIHKVLTYASGRKC